MDQITRESALPFASGTLQECDSTSSLQARLYRQGQKASKARVPKKFGAASPPPIVPFTAYRPLTLPSHVPGECKGGLTQSQSVTSLVPYRPARKKPVRLEPIERKEEDTAGPARRSKDDGTRQDSGEPSWISPADFIEFIMNHESLMEEFCYMNRVGPDDFQIVPFSKINPADYMTISIRGVTHYCGGELDCISLREWQRGQDLYQKMTRIPFFKKYGSWKMFLVWRRSMKITQVNVCSKWLNSNLAILDDNLRDSLLQVRAICYKLSSWNLFEVSSTQTVTLEEFEEMQNKRRAEVTSDLYDAWTEIKNELVASCGTSLKAFLLKNGFGKEESEDAHSGKERVVTYTERATTRTMCRKLTKFIRGCQYLFNTGLTEMVRNASYKFAELMRETRGGSDDDDQNVQLASKSRKKGAHGPRRPVFIIECFFEGADIVFRPPPNKFPNYIEQCLMENIKTISSCPPLLTVDELSQFTKVALSDADIDINENFASELAQILSNDRVFRELVGDIRSEFSFIFDQVRAYSQKYKVFAEIFVKNELLVDCSETFASATHGDLTDALNTYKAQLEDIKAIKARKTLGFFILDSRSMQNKLLPSPQRCWNLLSTYIPALAMEKQRALLKSLVKANDVLEALPKNVEEFVEFNAFVAQCAIDMGPIETQAEEINELFVIIKDYGIRTDKSAWGAFSELFQQLNTCRTRLQFAQDNTEANVLRFTSELTQAIPVLLGDTEAQVQKLKAPMLGSVEKMETLEGRKEVLAFLEEVEVDVQKAVNDAERFNKYQETLLMDLTPFDTVDDLKADFSLKSKLWRGIQAWEENTVSWLNESFGNVDVEVISKEVLLFSKTAVQASKGLPNNNVVVSWTDQVVSFKNTLPVVQALRCKALKPRHWEEIKALIGKDLDLDNEDFTLGGLLEMKVDAHLEAIQAIATTATSEQSLSEMLERVEKTWNDMELNLLPYKDSKDVFILGAMEDIITALEDSLVNISTIAGSRFVGAIREQVEEWQNNLLCLQETLDEWLMVQRNWMYLESIFCSADIKKQLPTESTKFLEVDGQFRAIMKETHEYALAFHAGTQPGRLALFKSFNDTLDAIQKSLEEYLLSKCVAFPRFFFLSNDELLEILSQTRNPRAVQPHLLKCFDNLARLVFAEGAKAAEILAMQSAEREEIPFFKPLKVRGNVEKWLLEVEDFMCKSVHAVLKKGWKDYQEQARKQWVSAQYCQVCITVGSIMWVLETEQVLTAKSGNALTITNQMQKWYHKNVMQLDELTELVRSKLTSIQRRSVVALVTQDVHNRDIIEALVEAKTTSINNFKWQQQLRYYWVADPQVDDCIIRQVDATLAYGHEYQGALTRLVITPLTDRCWMTITGALHIKRGAAPAGPAGTGKTESTKDLAKGMARQCVVFNCSDQIDYKMMGKLYSGVVSAGAWVCLDEFNRISIEVLSVVGQQVKDIQTALEQHLSDFIFEGRHLQIRPTCGIYITMNPGYAGRTELPDNLKVLFRPVSMMVPDYTLIAEIMLYAEGFGTAKKLSGKFTKLFKLSSEQLSKQDHYDFGMRAVKSVLVMAGSLKRSAPDLDEDVLLIRAMRDSNVPKFMADDLPLFFAITSDLFPGVEIPFIDYGELKGAIEFSLSHGGYQIHKPLVTKIIQLFETLNVRFGVTLVGPTTGGKSVNFQTLSKAMTKLRVDGAKDERYQAVKYKVLNPKCISMGELYGEFNEMTQEWTDGLGASLIREARGDESRDFKWVMFDGPIDAIWIESMNTVLDDNITLCLANGERIKLNWTMRMLFEVEDLAVASPATVSRLGMVYLTASEQGWRPYAKTWLHNLPSEPFTDHVKELIWALFEKHVDRGIEWVNKKGSEPVRTINNQLGISCCHMFQSVLNWNAATPNGCTSSDVDLNDIEALRPAFDVRELEEATFEKYITSVFCFAFTWSVGASLDTKTRGAFARDVEAWFDGVNLPSGCSVYDGYINLKEGPKWKKWDTIVPKFAFDPSLSYFQLLVPNSDTCCFAYLVDKMMSSLFACFVTGVTGIGKSVILQNLMETMKVTSGIVPIVMTFSAQTGAYATQLSIESKLEKKRKTLLGAPVNKKVALMIDDVNMPAVEEYGAQPPIELIRQLIDQKGLYDRKKLFWKDVENVALLLCAGPPGGGRSEMTPRMQRHTTIMCMPATSEEAMTTIFDSILNGFLTKFKQDCQSLCKPVVSASIEVYNRCGEELLPTPTRAHYTFNLRDVSKVFQGLLMVTPREVSTTDQLIRLWIHEVCRVFEDRLIDLDDKNWFKEVVAGLLKTKFHVNWEQDDWRQILWVDFLKQGNVYDECKDEKKLVKICEDMNDEYNLSHPTQMNLVFFRDCVFHITRVARVFRQPRGNMMLCGVGGSGRSSCARLCAAIGEMAEYEIALTKGYNMDSFKEDIKAFLISAGGGEGKPTMFLFNDGQIVNETMVEWINNILNSGEVPNLFAGDEVDKVVSELRPVAKEEGRSEAKDAVYQFFVERVRDKLHVCLTMSPVGSTLRVRMRMFPSLVNCTTIDWFLPWPAEALQSVSDYLLRNLESIPAETKEKMSSACCFVHQKVIEVSNIFLTRLRRNVYTTPKSYLDLVSLYLDMLSEKQEEKSVQYRRLSVGVQKIGEAKVVVTDLQAQIEAMQPVIKVKVKEADEMIPNVKKEQQKAAVEKTKVQGEEKEVRKTADQVRVIQEDAQRDLDVAMPALTKALKSLDSLDKKDITEIKSFAKPPPLVLMTLEAVNILLGEKPDWDTAKRVLGDSGFLERLKKFDKDNIPVPILKKLEKYVVKPEYQPDMVGNQSKAAKSLCMWTHAMDTYSKVAKEVEPKKLKLAEMNAQLDAAMSTLKSKQDALQGVLDHVAGLEKQLNDTIVEKDRLINEAKQCEARLKRADILTSGLADEGVRWEKTVAQTADDIQNLTGDVFLCSAAISYYGPFTGIYRSEIVDDWLARVHQLGIPAGQTFDLYKVIGNPVEMREWNLQGLPADAVSLNNGILVTRGKRWPLMIDPQAQANNWIKHREGKELKVLKMTHPKMLLILENCIRTGSPLLMEEIGEILDPALEPVLQKAIVNNGGRKTIRLGDSDVDYDPNFKFYMTTKMPNPHYFPEVCIKVTVINFTVTTEGLEEQLLNETVLNELPESVQKKTDLMLQLANDKKILQDLEDEILRLLSESSGNILDDEALINTLGRSKTTSKEVNERVKDAEVTTMDIEVKCKRYTPVARIASILYFVIADLANINPMYQFSLFYFQRLFNRCLTTAEKNDDLMERLRILTDKITSSVFANVCRGLFEENKLLFGFLFAFAQQKEDGTISMPEWSLLLRGVPKMDMSAKPDNPDVEMFTDKQWDFLYALQEKGSCLANLCQHITDNLPDWTAWANEDDLHLLPLPTNYEEENDLTFFHRLLVLKGFSPEKVIYGIQECVRNSLGERYVVFPATFMHDVYDDTTKSTPVIFVLTTGADPTSFLLRFCAKMDKEETLGSISLGQGQGPKAQKMIEAAQKDGSWVLLQNCHLAKSWMPNLARICDGMESNANQVHRDFRLFLTSMPADYFPVPVLQNGVKLTNEPPKGFRANVTRSMLTVTNDDLDKCTKTAAWRRLQWGLKFFHALIQERRKFGPLGWNIRYEFNDSDLETSNMMFLNLLEQDGDVPWDTLQFVCGQINYGGRVTDDWDRRCLMAILDRFVCEDVMTPGYSFSESGIYRCPDGIDTCDVQELKDFVDHLPMFEMPELFGMNENANIAYQQQATDTMIDIVLSIQPREVAGAGGKTPEEIASEIAVEQISLMPAGLTDDGAHESTFACVGASLLMNSLGTALLQEMLRFNKLLGTLRKALHELLRAIKGLIVMTQDLDDMFTAMTNNQVPPLLEKVAYPSLKPLSSWFADMIQRVEFFKGWIEKGPPFGYWISAMFFPQGFLTAVLQGYSRSNNISVDVLGFEFVVQDYCDPAEIEKAPAEGILVYGLFMDGAKWNYEENCIDSQEFGEMFVHAPVIQFVQCQNYVPDPSQYTCPVYKTSVRAGTLSTTGHSTNFVLPIEVDTLEPPNMWVLAGAAFLTMLND